MTSFSSTFTNQLENDLNKNVESDDMDHPASTTPISVSLSLAAAIRAHQQGKMEKAVKIYSSILQKYPDNSDANYLLGVAAFERGLNADAVAMIENAIACDPNNAAYYGKLGEILTLIGDTDRANDAYEKAADLSPDDVRFYLGRAQLLERQGKIDKALHQYREICKKWHDVYEAFYKCAVLEARIGQKDSARRNVQKAIRLNADFADAHYLYGLLVVNDNAEIAAKHLLVASQKSRKRDDLHMKVANKLIQLKEFDKATVALRYVSEHDAKNINAFALMGDCLFEMHQLEGALISYDKALDIDPTRSQILAKKAQILLKLGQVSDALEVAFKAKQLSPNDWESLCALGCALRADDQVFDAIENLTKSVQLAPQQKRPLLEIAEAFKDNLDLDNALRFITKAQEIFLHDRDVRQLHSEILLQSEQWKNGFRLFETEHDQDYLDFEKNCTELGATKWDGLTQVDKRLLVFCPSHISDTIQFMRFLRYVLSKVKEIYLYCPKEMARQLATFKGIKGVIVAGTPIGKHDLFTHLNDIARLLGINTTDFLKGNEPYMAAHSSDVEEWKEKLKRYHHDFKVGLVWQGDHKYEKDRKRSPGIWPFSRLFYMRNIDFFSLQLGAGKKVLQDPQLAKVVHDCSNDLIDLADTAALIDALDLVITCDTAVAHLAGAMGKESWVVLPYACDWRWGTPKEGEIQKSRWYSSLKLYRQSAHGDWADVFARIGHDLENFVSGFKSKE